MSGPLAAAQHIFDHDLTAERWRQLKTWGVQHHPDGTGLLTDRESAATARNIAANRVLYGEVQWRHLLLKEVWEALAETERSRLRAKLVSLATVAVAWVEDVDGRAGDRAAVVEPEPADAELAARQSTDAVREDLQRWMVSA